MAANVQSMRGEEVLSRIRDTLAAEAHRQKTLNDQLAKLGRPHPEREATILAIGAACDVMTAVIALGGELRRERERGAPDWMKRSEKLEERWDDELKRRERMVVGLARQARSALGAAWPEEEPADAVAAAE